MGFLSPLPLTGLGSGPGASGFKSVQPALWAASGFLPEGTKNVQGTVQSQNATVAGVVNRLAVHNLSGSVQSQSATVSGTVLADKIVSGSVQSQSATVSGTLTVYPLPGFSLTDFSVGWSGLDPDSPFAIADPEYQNIEALDKCHYQNLTPEDSLTIEMDGLGEFTVTAGVITQPNTFDVQIYDLSDGTFGALATITVHPEDANVILSGSVQSQSATVTGSVNNFSDISLSGTVQSQDATVSGVLVASAGPTVLAFGSVQSQSATVTGAVERAITSIGNVQSQNATVTGDLGKIVKASGAVQSQNATVTGDLRPPVEEPGTADSRRIKPKFINRKIRRKSNQRKLN